ncbi:SSI family serine proteinase inhibitor [Tomitella cavernea]|uniref:Subtilisin inhibitor domain-containing protein n=1 Tax=Tomitella cavernea TaxID=1387982 RepID=A0ABP9CVK4_9ACTN|nr:SSI family serine proteinase inhibitor [Tomitella cavernea]
MHTFTRTFVGAAGAAALSAGLFAGVAGAAPSGSIADSPVGFGAFVLTSGTDAAGLICPPDVGTHPDPAQACDSIRKAGGNFEALPRDMHVLCPMIYMPTPARAVGVWVDAGGPRIVDYSHTYGNGCVAAAASGGVFGF